MAIKKSELYSSLWASCDELRGGMDASQYKDYVLAMLFIKYVSDKYANEPFGEIKIPDGASFKDMVAMKGKSDIGDQINKKIIGPLEKANDISFGGVDFNDPTKLGDGKEKVDRLTNLIGIFENPKLDFSKNKAGGDDLLGDAYEYLMRHFATQSGKSKGQFYTPAEVSRLIAQLIGIRRANVTNSTTVYDPTCGSGSLLIKVADEASHDRDVRVTLYGQEKEGPTAGLARMNMVLHDYATAEIRHGNTLSNPLFRDGAQLWTFDYVVANPPFSDKRWSTGLHPNEGGKPADSGEQTATDYGRFIGYGIPPRKNGDYAYLLHIIRSIKPDGKGACVLPHGVLSRGNAEDPIRRSLVHRGYIKGIIGLPSNLFYGTGIAACIIIIDKENAAARKGIFMIDASKGFRKDGPKNRLREQDVHKIVDTFMRQVEIPRYSRLVPVSEIADTKNDYNLNLLRYIDSSEPEDLQDIDGHLRGGIPERDIDALDSYWKVIPQIRSVLFEGGGRVGYCQLKVPAAEVKPTIFGHEEFTRFISSVNKVFDRWKETNVARLTSFTQGDRPKVLSETISEDLLATFNKTPLFDPYDVYQHLMDYWSETMQDDCYLISAHGWKAAAQPREVLKIENKDKKLVWPEPHDYMIGKRRFKSDLIQATILIDHYFVAERDAIQTTESERAAIEQELETQMEDQGGEDGLLSEVIEGEDDKRRITGSAIKKRLKEIGDDAEFSDEKNALEKYALLLEKQSDMKEHLKKAKKNLDEKIHAKYPTLTELEIKTLVVDDKWVAALTRDVQSELNRVSQTLTRRIRQLAERYERPLPKIIWDVKTLAARVDQHLTKMGAKCNRITATN